jgi:hypothetical protein
VAFTNIDRVSKELYSIESLQSLDLRSNGISFRLEDCPDVVKSAALDLSGNYWKDVPLSTVLSCLVKPNSSLAELSLQDMGLRGPIYSHAALGSIRRFRVDRNFLMCEPNSSLYSLDTDLAELSISETLLGSCYSLDLHPVPVVKASTTFVTYCYDGALISSPTLSALSLLDARPSPTCNRAKERTALTSTFPVCCDYCSRPVEAPDAYLRSGLNSTLCRLRTRVVFPRSNITCPSWSTTPSDGSAQLTVDAAFLSFWGCVCQPGHFLGYVSLDELNSETDSLAIDPNMSIGQRETILLRRTCQRCPDGLPISCSPLTTANPPHVMKMSVYPFQPGGGAPLRSRLPYMSRVELVACLHPDVCGGPSIRVDDWDRWTPSGPVDSTPEYGDAFMCREGHDVRSPLCATCVQGYWLDGFLCRRCIQGAEALAVVALLLGLALLAYVVWRHHLASSGAHHNYASIVLWYFQVSQALQVSIQINAAQSGDALAGADSSSLSDLLPALSFRPWALECLSRAWDYRASSTLLFALPWAVAAVGLALPSWRRASVFALDLLFLPVAQRAVQWFNQLPLPYGQVRVRFLTRSFLAIGR